MPPTVKKTLKIGIGVFFIPLSFLAGLLWPWWEKQHLSMQIVTGPIILPIVGLVYLIAFWYNDL